MKQLICAGIVGGILAVCASAFALTAAEVIALKKAGISEETIQLMVRQEQMGVREVVAPDGSVRTFYSTGVPGGRNCRDEEREKLERAWKMLENIRIDNRP